jgi:hypothetical protein
MADAKNNIPCAEFGTMELVPKMDCSTQATNKFCPRTVTGSNLDEISTVLQIVEVQPRTKLLTEVVVLPYFFLASSLILVLMTRKQAAKRQVSLNVIKQVLEVLRRLVESWSDRPSVYYLPPNSKLTPTEYLKLFWLPV